MVILTHAIIYPLTVVVKFIDAAIANVTVPRILRVDGLTIWTEPLSIIFFNQLVKM